jgi:hypothetical protein
MPRRLANPAAIQAHLDAVQGCEFAPFIACCGGHGATEIHHVLRGPNRVDASWNLVSLCPFAHEWCHEQTVNGMVLAWWVLHLRSAFDREAIHKQWMRNPMARIEEVANDSTNLVRDQARKLLEVYGDA